MAKTSQGLTRPITRAQANSYEKSFPNPGERPRLGVTHLVELNGPGAYEEYYRRYEQTRQILEPEEAKVRYTPKQKAALRKMSAARRSAFKEFIENPPSKAKKRTSKKRTSKKKSGSTYVSEDAFVRKQMRAGRSKKQAENDWRLSKQSKSRRKAAASKSRGTVTLGRKYAPKKKALKRSERPNKSEFISSQMSRGRSKKQAEAAWRLAHGRHISKTSHKGRQTRTYAKKYNALAARIGPKKKWTYKYATEKGQVRDIPVHALYGFQTRKEFIQTYDDIGNDDLPKGRQRRAEALRKKMERLEARRERDAAKAFSRIKAGKGMFTPNADEEITYEEFITMRPKSMKRNPRRRKQTAKQRAASLRNLKKARSAKKKSTRKKATRRKATTRRTTTRGRKRSSTRMARASKMVVYVSNKKKPVRRRKSLRTYKRNAMGAYQTDLTRSLKIGAFVTGGFITHRVLTKLLAEQLSKVEFFQKDKVKEYTGLISGTIVAGVGIAGTTAAFKKQSDKQLGTSLAAGMAASLLHAAIYTAMSKIEGTSKYAGHIANYANAGGRAYNGVGSYYSFQPHQRMSGVGEYYQTPTAGFGALTQAAAGMGQITQAAAGYGSAPMLTQAAAGYGDAQITQAAAGTGEYVAYGVEGLGEYEQASVSGMVTHTDEGIAPNLHSAEQALSQAEAMAGVGRAEVPLQSTVNPVQMTSPISNLPGGSRAGVFQGGDGIFG